MKYVVMEFKFNGLTVQYPIIFPNNLVHSGMAEAVTEVLTKQLQEMATGIKPVSAGEVTFHGEVNCSGGSVSLELKSRKVEDETLIHLVDYTAGIIA